jgi:hypothetical protein
MCRFSIVGICLALLVGCASEKQSGPTIPEPAKPVASATQIGEYELQPALYAGNVQIIPITSTKSSPKNQDGDFMTLEEAKKLDAVEITELGDGDVNALRVANKGNRPLLLLGGDLLLGGKQDRIVARDTIVHPGKTVNVDVYCVEQGRWEGASRHFDYKSTVVPSKVREAAAFESQQGVWGAVADYNASVDYAGASTTVHAGLDSEKTKKAIDENLPKILTQLKDRKDLVGFVYLVNGELQSADLFGSPRIMAQAKESLLKGYLAEGAGVATDATRKIDMGSVEKFMKDVIEGRSARMPALQAGASGLFRGRGTWGVELKGGKGEGEFVHGSYSKPK